ncbi:hypothetical protein GRJ2_001872700 [Grus japonensis]|uniref:Uncharacterized protein n=1 Tax=Grus japonensis TaxID=30415 RepID=A0ABC9X944_GRUJA
MVTATGPVSSTVIIKQDGVQGPSKDALQHLRNRVSSRHTSDTAQERSKRPSLSLNGVTGQRFFVILEQPLDINHCSLRYPGSFSFSCNVWCLEMKFFEEDSQPIGM